MKAHPYADCFPMLSDAELLSLTEDIRINGQAQPIIVDQNDRIVDGRNRFAACQRLEIDVLYETRKLTDDEALHLVGSLNLHRRHMTGNQRAAAGVKLANLASGERADLKRQGVSQETPSLNPVSIADAAKATGASTGSIKRRKKIERDGTAELIQAVDDGSVGMTVAADAISNMPADEQNQAIEEIRTGKKTQRDVREEFVECRQANEEQERSKDGKRKPKGVGVRHAHDAIACLKKIPKNDGLRSSGFKIVSEYIRHNK